MQEDSSRNTIIFLVCALGLFIVYQMFVLEPAQKRRQAELAAARPAATAQQAQRPGAPVLNVPPAVTRAAALAASPRVPIVTPALKGSISLKGARIDDLYLTQYRETVDRNSPPVELLRPEGAPHAWFAEMGWTGANVPGLPTSDTVWTLAQGSTLSPGQPVVLTYANGQGLTFSRRIDVDDRFMFTITDTVANNSAAPVTLAPYGSIQRQGMPVASAGSQVVHEGAVGALGEDKPTLKLIKYKKWAKDGATGPIASKGGWVGITDKYWLAALIPNQGEALQGQFRDTKAGGLDIFDANFVGAARAVGPGQQVTETTHFFGGAKTVPVLQSYQDKLGIPRFDSAVDWGMFWFFTRPIFTFLQYIYSHVGSFGVAILVLTVAVRLLFFPIANKQYESMTKMKKVQPQMEELRKRYKDDPAKQQQEIMALYQREKVNPVAGCLPLLLQIPVFFALYKVLSVTIEMRHAPFLGWIRDLSARDPTTVWNLFGAIPWNPAHAPLIGGLLDTSLHIGILPLIYGVSMWLSTTMNPPAPDPTQQRIFQLMPVIFTFIMAPFAVGLLIYWTWTNVLSILQQYVIMRRFKVDNPIDRIIGKLTGRAKAAG
ncbi:membrane protein insertase YidC [Phenylobacterium hankyongense]|uniref:Membrane protein insertase YidC n=1 Tax=Phenylobacterium hankyongense TaxID=1813876 RepID=A0A328AYA8_9CAUL|nr:membrane protein insertase YidC [Phenylobacterium hankyongense]RAK59913.1 membrane protein insertase YidC [Phenylobacterium hankyongense]